MTSDLSVAQCLACRKLHWGSAPRVKVPFRGSPWGETHQQTPTCSKHCTACQAPESGSHRGMKVGLWYRSAALWFFSLSRSH
jgi:hypothetical protein